MQVRCLHLICKSRYRRYTERSAGTESDQCDSILYKSLIQPFGAGNLTSEVLGMDGAANYISEHGMDTYWDDEAGQNVASVEDEDGIYTIWVEDEQSIGEKMKLIQENQLAGVAEWKLGFERASVWPVIAQYLQ